MGIVLVYDCTAASTFDNIASWIKQIADNALPGVPKILVANKTDLPTRVISEEKGRELAEANGFSFFEASAKAGTNVNKLFHHITKEIIDNQKGRMEN